MRNQYLFWAILLCLVSNSKAFSQEEKRDTGINLVPNPSFEILKRKVPDTPMEPFMAFRKLIKNWNSPTETTPDLVFYINSDNYETARTGDQMIGILTHNPNSKKSDSWREYIQVRLDLELEVGEEYLIEFWVMRHPQATIASNNMGALLSRVPISTHNTLPITNLVLAVNQEAIINPSKPTWEKISTIYTAKGDERFLLIGNFFSNEDTQFKDVKNTAEPAWNNPYYLLDDVSIQQLIKPEPEPIPEPEPEIGLADIEVKKGDVIKLDKIYFDFNKSNLLSESYIQLNELVALLNKYPNMRIAINGHTDSKGSDRYNETLSDNRCKSVYHYLIQQFIDANRLEYKGYGEIYPIDTNQTDEGRQNNRRVEFVILEVDDNQE